MSTLKNWTLLLTILPAMLVFSACSSCPDGDKTTDVVVMRIFHNNDAGDPYFTDSLAYTELQTNLQKEVKYSKGGSSVNLPLNYNLPTTSFKIVHAGRIDTITFGKYNPRPAARSKECGMQVVISKPEILRSTFSSYVVQSFNESKNELTINVYK